MEPFVSHARRTSAHRARRAVLGLLVACSLALLAANFAEPTRGGLHAAQREVLAITAPVQEHTSRMLNPLRDLAATVADTIAAARELPTLRRQLAEARAEAIANRGAARENRRLRGLLRLDARVRLVHQRPVTARVIGQSPETWSATVVIDRGSNSGVRVDQPVVTGDGLVGKVTRVAADAAVVTLITDSSVAVAARVNETGARGVVSGGARALDDPLVLQYVTGRVRPRQAVVTAGTGSRDLRLPSLFPAGIPIGSVTRVDDPATEAPVIDVRPFVDMRRLELVQVLTEADASRRFPRGA